MPSDSAAVIIACVSGAVSLTTAAGVEVSRRRTARALQDLQLAQSVELEAFKDRLSRTREAATKQDEATRLVAKYRDPLLRSAFDLQTRIYNVLQGKFKARKNPDYFRWNTLFLFGEFLGWLEIIRREMQFLDLGAVGATEELGLRLRRVQHVLARTSGWDDDCYIYRGEQRAIGELMLTRVEADETGGRRHECMGYAAFVAANREPEFGSWFQRLGDAIERLPDEAPPRLFAVQHALIDLIDCLDPEHARFQENRERLDDPSGT